MHFPHGSDSTRLRIDREPERGLGARRSSCRPGTSKTCCAKTRRPSSRRPSRPPRSSRITAATARRRPGDASGRSTAPSREPFEGGFEQAEVEAAFAALEQAIERRALARMPKEELAWGLGLVATALGHARAELGRTFATLAHASRPGAVDLTSVFRRSDVGARSAEELVHPV